MKRFAMDKLDTWKSSSRRKPLILNGIRQVGKTWLLREFGKTRYSNTAYFNFDENTEYKQFFQTTKNVKRLIQNLSLASGQEIHPETTLIIFDEIQEVPAALTSLKYFQEEAPHYRIICAGSLLGIALHEGTSFPVGKVEFMDLYPLTFSEFLLAMDKEQLNDLIRNQEFDLATPFRDMYADLLKQYYYVGGMPEVVASYSVHQDFNEARIIQKRILDAYEQDFSKHAPYNLVPRLRMVWNSIPSQLAKENKKFVYGLIREGARAKEYEMALLWLFDSGLAHRVYRVDTPKLPLLAYEDLRAFKLFLVDVGLLSCMLQIDPRLYFAKNELFIECKGALTEQYVLQQLKTSTKRAFLLGKPTRYC